MGVLSSNSMADSTSRQEIELLQGLVADTLEVSADASLESGIDAQVAAKASSTDGTSDAKSHLKTAEGLKTSNLDVGGSATVDVENLLEVSADATGVTGDGSARSEVERTTALEAFAGITISEPPAAGGEQPMNDGQLKDPWSAK